MITFRFRPTFLAWCSAQEGPFLTQGFARRDRPYPYVHVGNENTAVWFKHWEAAT